jgi:hypothetical protein
MDWIDRLQAFVGRHAGWNTDEEKQAVLRQLAAARAVYARQAGGRP